MTAICTYCGEECEGTSGIARSDGGLDPYCHEGQSPTCYEVATSLGGMFGMPGARITLMRRPPEETQ